MNAYHDLKGARYIVAENVACCGLCHFREVPILYAEHDVYRWKESFFFRKDIARVDLAGFIFGMVAQNLSIENFGELDEWNCVFRIGSRVIRPVLVSAGIEPHAFLYVTARDVVYIQNCKSIKEFIQRVVAAAGIIVAHWKKEIGQLNARRWAETMPAPGEDDEDLQPTVIESFLAVPAKPTDKPKRKSTAKRRVRPGELLPAAERNAMLEAGNDVLRSMLADMSQVPQPPVKPVQIDQQST